MQRDSIQTIFNQQGYLALRKFLSLEHIQEIKQQIAKVINTSISLMPKEHVFYEQQGNNSSLKQLQKLENYSDYFYQLGHSPVMIELAEKLLNGPAVLKNIQYFNKSPSFNSATPPHQDGYYFKITPQNAITMWLSLGDADANNGAVCYLPSSHKQGLRVHQRSQVLGFSQSIADWTTEDSDNEIQMTASAGDLLVHHSLTIHRANANSGQRERRSIGLIFYAADAKIDQLAVREYSLKLTQSMKSKGQI